MITSSSKANPGPLGLLGFGMTTILLNLHNIGLTSLSMVILAMGVALGGAAQVIAGVLEFVQGNTFGGTAFTAYGLFWWSLVIIWLGAGRGPDAAVLSADKTSMGFYLLLWCIFTAFMFVGTLRHNVATQVVFGSLTALFFFLALGDFTSVELITHIAGGIGLVCGGSAVYAAVAQVVNGEYHRSVLPMGDVVPPAVPLAVPQVRPETTDLPVPVALAPMTPVSGAAPARVKL